LRKGRGDANCCFDFFCFRCYNTSIMSKLTIKQIEHIVKLSRLGITDAEKESFSKDLSAILGFVEQLNEVDVSGVSPTSHAAGIVNAMRDDAMNQYDKQKDLIAAAPAKKENLVKVKAVFD